MSNSFSPTAMVVCVLLTILLTGLKLGDVIDWSWWWVLSPIWIPLLIALVILVVAKILMGLSR